MPHLPTTGGELVNLNRVIRFESEDHGHHLGWFLDECGEARCAWFDSLTVEQAMQAVVPNTTAYQFADYSVGEDGTLHVNACPIIAWRLHDGNAEPLTSTYRDTELAGGYPLIAPSGEVHVGDVIFDNVSSFEDYLTTEYKRREELLRRHRAESGRSA